MIETGPSSSRSDRSKETFTSCVLNAQIGSFEDATGYMPKVGLTRGKDVNCEDEDEDKENVRGCL